MKTALFVFAHQDDEIAAVSRIVYELEQGKAVSCVFLTDGRYRNVLPETRNEESLSVLRRLGVEESRVRFPGTSIPITDGSLVDHLEVALREVEQLTESWEMESVYCLAWEGGHHDHDASHLVAAAYAARRGLPSFELPLYHGHRTPGSLFRVLSPLSVGGPWRGRALSGASGWRLSLLPLLYRSQRRSWIGLFPEAFVKLAILRRERLRPVDLERIWQRPHEGPLFYERRFGVSYERFAKACEDFRRRHFPL